MLRTIKDLKDYMKWHRLPYGVVLDINKERHVKPWAPNGEKYTLYYASSFGVIAHANNVNDARNMLEQYLERLESERIEAERIVEDGMKLLTEC